MKIKCPECEARFKLPDEQYRQGMKLRCSRCKHVFRAGPPAEGRVRKADVLEATIGPGSAMAAKSAFDSLDDILQSGGAPLSGVSPPPDEPSLEDAPAPNDPFAMDDPFEATRGPFGPSDAPARPQASSGLDDLAASLPDERPTKPLDDVIGDIFAESGTKSEDVAPMFEDATANHLGAGPPSQQPSGSQSSPDLEPSDYGFGDLPPIGDLVPGGGAAPGSDSLDDFMAKDRDEAAESSTLGRIGLLPRGVKPRTVEERRSDLGSLADDMDEDFTIERNAPPDPEDAAAGFLGDAQRAAQFSFDEDEGDAQDAFDEEGAFFDPNRKGVTAPASRGRKPRQLPARRPKRTVTTGKDGEVIGPAPAVSDLVVAANRSIAQALANVLLILMLIGCAFLGFVAFSNDGLLDFAALDDQIAAAFGRGAYQGREAAESHEEAPEEAPSGVTVENLEQMFFPNKEGRDLFVIEGRVVNRTEHPVSNVKVSGTVRDPRGKVLATQEAPAGRVLKEEELLDVVDEDALTPLYEQVAEEASSIDLAPRQAMRFSLVFAALDADASDKRTYTVETLDFDSEGDRDDDEAGESPSRKEANGKSKRKRKKRKKKEP